MKLTLIIAILSLASCHVAKNITTTKVNTDSIVHHVTDSLNLVHKQEIESYQKHIEELASSGVTFVTDSCPERDAVLLLLDSAGRANYEKAVLQDKVKSLTNKVTISERGVITAEGKIKSAYFSNYKMSDELRRSEITIDSLNEVIDKKDVQLVKAVEVKEKVITRTVFPWYFWLFLVLAAALVWIVRGRLPIIRAHPP